MIRLFWVHGRFSWAFLVIVAYLTATLMVIDYVWRVVVMQFDTFLLYALGTATLFFLVMIALLLRWRKRVLQ